MQISQRSEGDGTVFGPKTSKDIDGCTGSAALLLIFRTPRFAVSIVHCCPHHYRLVLFLYIADEQQQVPTERER